jgi:hypothetical protein
MQFIFEDSGCFPSGPWNQVQEPDLKRMVQIDVLEKPIERIKETCAMMGIAEQFDRALPDFETFLEARLARGEVSESRLTFDGLLYLKQMFAKDRSRS